MSDVSSSSPLRSLGSRLIGLLGLNRSILLASGPRFFGMVLGPIGSIIIVYTLSTAQQGMFYVFMSMLGLRSFFELGATACIGQMTPHHLSEDGKTPSAEMVSIAQRWMATVALIFGLFSLALGFLYLTWCGYRDPWTHILWIAAVIPTALSGIQEGRLQLMYGAGQVDEVSRIRWWVMIFQYVVQWGLLLVGAGLLSFSCAALAVVIIQEWRLRKGQSWLFGASSRTDTGLRAQLRSEMGSLVKRSSIVYLAGFFVLNIQQPILFRFAGAEASARFGFTLMIINSLLGTASLWGMTAFPHFARSVAEGRVDEGFKKFRATWFRAVFVASLALIAAVCAVEILRMVPRFHDRLMPLLAMLPLGIAVWIQTVGNCATYWPRAFKQEPYVPTAVTQMLITPLVAWLAVIWYGPDAISWANLISWIAGGMTMFFITRAFLPGRPLAVKFQPKHAD